MTEQSQADQDKEVILYSSWFKRHAHSHFFEAMKQGYVSSSPKSSILELPGLKTLEYYFERWRLLDAYFVTPLGDRSGGSTTIWYGDIPIWIMQYLGWYQDMALPCLKAALRVNYEKDIFYGGRGPESFVLDGHLYANQVEQNNFFGHSNGLETIYSPEGTILGKHRYQAEWLVTGGLW